MESKCPDETLCMHEMNLNMCILRMLEDTFSLGAAQIIIISFFFLCSRTVTLFYEKASPVQMCQIVPDRCVWFLLLSSASMDQQCISCQDTVCHPISSWNGLPISFMQDTRVITCSKKGFLNRALLLMMACFTGIFCSKLIFKFTNNSGDPWNHQHPSTNCNRFILR